MAQPILQAIDDFFTRSFVGHEFAATNVRQRLRGMGFSRLPARLKPHIVTRRQSGGRVMLRSKALPDCSSRFGK
jgi:hypothetical protein